MPALKAIVAVSLAWGFELEQRKDIHLLQDHHFWLSGCCFPYLSSSIGVHATGGAFLHASDDEHWMSSVQGHEDDYAIYVHSSDPEFKYPRSHMASNIFVGREIPSQHVGSQIFPCHHASTF